MPSRKILLLVGLGNPGSQYTNTRHNVGFMILKKLAIRESTNFRQSKKLFGSIADIRVGNECQRLLMPNTYMNESGRSIRAAMNWIEIEVDQLLILVDDIDLPLGKIRLRRQGSAGGHNGLRSAIQHLGTKDFCRIRVGIGSPINRTNDKQAKTVSHVLGKFTKKEMSILEEVIDEVIEGIDVINRAGLEEAINQLNSYKPINT